MNRLTVLLVVMSVSMAVSTSTAVAQEWQIDPPAGWSRNEQLEKPFFAGRGAIPGIQRELRLWLSPDRSSMLVVEWYLADLKHRTDLEVIAVLDASPFDGNRHSTRVEKREQFVDLQVVRDSTEMASGTRIRRIRRYQRTNDGLHALVMICSGPGVTPCDAAVEHARLVPRTAPAEDSDARREGPGEHARPWRFWLGLVLGMAGLTALVVALLARRQQRRPRGMS